MITPTGEVHPAADLFPLLEGEELAELVADIAQNGLLYPLVLDRDGRLVDGRNRLRACELAGVMPRYVELNETDPVAYILATNVQRRHLNKGQRAMAVVLAGLLRTTGTRALATTLNLSHDGLSKANTVVTYTPELAAQVMSGAKPLADAYEAARLVKATREGREGRLAQLRDQAPDLAERVDAGMDLAEAAAAAQERFRAQQRERELTTRAVVEAVERVESLAGSAAVRADALAQFVPAIAKGAPITAARLRRAAAGLQQLAEEWETDGSD